MSEYAQAFRNMLHDRLVEFAVFWTVIPQPCPDCQCMGYWVDRLSKARDILTTLRAHCPDAHFYIVGKTCSGRILPLQDVP